MRIDHPAVQGENVSLWRWLKFHIGEWLENIGRNMAWRALYPKRDPDELPF